VGILIWQVGWAWPEEKCTQAPQMVGRLAAGVRAADPDLRHHRPVIADPQARAEAMRAVGRVPRAEIAPKP
jgi:hypothetical protein